MRERKYKRRGQEKESHIRMLSQDPLRTFTPFTHLASELARARMGASNRMRRGEVVALRGDVFALRGDTLRGDVLALLRLREEGTSGVSLPSSMSWTMCWYTMRAGDDKSSVIALRTCASAKPIASMRLTTTSFTSLIGLMF